MFDFLNFFTFFRSFKKLYEKICTQMCWFPNKHIIFDGRGVERGGGGVGGSRFAG